MPLTPYAACGRINLVKEGGTPVAKDTALELCLRLNADEAQRLIENARKCGLTRSAYLRRLIMNKPVKARPTKDIQKLIGEINKIGSNVNQIARSVIAGIASPDTAAQSLFLLDRVYEKLDEAVRKWR